ncbi:WbqC-like protein family protein [Cyclobacterium xiamenense]|uniref:WbqC-like protein family protein n=1 Tax=Cyclobacterium xiamenense TaxID=1297121 RepID=A0A1H7ADZ6_9BACT|nr:WbqC family protein [Cyclobacterium xiamenense]SEJ59235.1 WbqC-like protein family protein [Cyclobacterium xiamenense]
MNNLLPGVLADALYLPVLPYFVAVRGAREIVLAAGDQLSRQSFVNKTRIRLANKVEMLSVPVYGVRKKQAIRDLRIDYDQKWLNVHLRGLQSAYGKAPFFEYFYSDLERVYLQKHPYLLDLNRELLTLCLKFLGWDVKLRVEEAPVEEAHFRDIRGLIHPKRLKERQGIYHPQPYQQIFGADFAPDLSIVDLLFCEGPGANRILDRSEKSN